MKPIYPNFENNNIIKILDNAALSAFAIYGNTHNDIVDMLTEMRDKYFKDVCEKYIKLNINITIAIKKLIIFYIASAKPEIEKISEEDIKSNFKQYFIEACSFLDKNKSQADIFYKINSKETIYYLMLYMKWIEKNNK